MKMDKNNDDYCFYMARVNIKKYRKQKEISQQELADKTGYTYQYIRDLECLSITKRPKLHTLSIIASALNIELKQLFDEID